MNSNLVASIDFCRKCGTAVIATEESEEHLLNPQMGRATCTARRGVPVGLEQSPDKETSYVKHCASSERDTMHDSGVDDDAETGESLHSVNRDPPRFTRHVGSYLADYAAGWMAFVEAECCM